MTGFLYNSLKYGVREHRRLAHRARKRAESLRAAGNPHAADCEAVAIVHDKCAALWLAALEIGGS